MEWTGIEAVAALLGIDDVETLIAQLVVLRDNQDKF